MQRRPILDREMPKRAWRDRQANPALVERATLADMRHATARVVVGQNSGDWLERARRDALMCLPPNMQNQIGAACGCGPNGKPDPNGCGTQGLRYVTVGGSNPADTVVGTSYTITLSPQAPFKPELIAIGAVKAPSVLVTAINYGPINMLIGGTIGGEMFATTNDQGGYRLPSSQWIYPGTTITITYTALAVIVASQLSVMAFGFTSSPG